MSALTKQANKVANISHRLNRIWILTTVSPHVTWRQEVCSQIGKSYSQLCHEAHTRDFFKIVESNEEYISIAEEVLAIIEAQNGIFSSVDRLQGLKKEKNQHSYIDKLGEQEFIDWLMDKTYECAAICKRSVEEAIGMLYKAFTYHINNRSQCYKDSAKAGLGINLLTGDYNKDIQTIVKNDWLRSNLTYIVIATTKGAV